MLKFELFNLKCMASNLSWKDKTITIKDNIKYILTSLEHYKFIDSKDIDHKAIDTEDIQLPFTYSDIIKYWLNNIEKYNKLFSIDFKLLKIGINYSLAPIYVSRYTKGNNINNTYNFIVIGIFLIDYNNINIPITILATSKKYTFLSNILDNSKKYNIILGILKYQNETKDIKDIKYINDEDRFENIYLEIDNNISRIPIKTILSNACNYLPKLEIIKVYNNNNNNNHKNNNKKLQGCFKIS